MTLVCGFDLETTDAKPESTKIVELALQVIEFETWTTKIRYTRRFNPQTHISKGALLVHGIADADVVGCPLFSSVAPTLVAIFARVDVFVGHNIIGFDFQVLANELARCAQALTRAPEVIDTMVEGRWATPDGKQPTLGELCYALDVPYDPNLAHAAAYDVDCALLAFRRGVELGYFVLPVTTDLQMAA